jgi:Xaa-Pro aminopeptidase
MPSVPAFGKAATSPASSYGPWRRAPSSRRARWFRSYDRLARRTDRGGARTRIRADRRRRALVVDLSPVDPDSGCCADVTRTFCLGEPPAELVEYHRLCVEALERALAVVRPGVLGSEPFRVVCEFFGDHGYATQLSKDPGEVLEDGFFHGLGHGIGLEVHESPYLGRNGEEIVAGDVLAVEPGLYRKDFGGVRLEDDVVVTEAGVRRITEYPYDLEP